MKKRIAKKAVKKGLLKLGSMFADNVGMVVSNGQHNMTGLHQYDLGTIVVVKDVVDNRFIETVSFGERIKQVILQENILTNKTKKLIQHGHRRAMNFSAYEK